MTTKNNIDTKNIQNPIGFAPALQSFTLTSNITQTSTEFFVLEKIDSFDGEFVVVKISSSGEVSSGTFVSGYYDKIGKIVIVKKDINPVDMLTERGNDFNYVSGSLVQITTTALTRVTDMLNGDKNLPTFPIVDSAAGTPDNQNRLITRKDLDAATFSGAGNASTTSKGVTKLTTSPSDSSNPLAVGDNDTRVLTTTEKTNLQNFLAKENDIHYNQKFTVSDTSIFAVGEAVELAHTYDTKVTIGGTQGSGTQSVTGYFGAMEFTLTATKTIRRIYNVTDKLQIENSSGDVIWYGTPTTVTSGSETYIDCDITLTAGTYKIEGKMKYSTTNTTNGTYSEARNDVDNYLIYMRPNLSANASLPTDAHFSARMEFYDESTTNTLQPIDNANRIQNSAQYQDCNPIGIVKSIDVTNNTIEVAGNGGTINNTTITTGDTVYLDYSTRTFTATKYDATTSIPNIQTGHAIGGNKILIDIKRPAFITDSIFKIKPATTGISQIIPAINSKGKVGEVLVSLPSSSLDFSVIPEAGAKDFYKRKTIVFGTKYITVSGNDIGGTYTANGNDIILTLTR